MIGCGSSLFQFCDLFFDFPYAFHIFRKSFQFILCKGVLVCFDGISQIISIIFAGISTTFAHHAEYLVPYSLMICKNLVLLLIQIIQCSVGAVCGYCAGFRQRLIGFVRAGSICCAAGCKQ